MVWVTLTEWSGTHTLLKFEWAVWAYWNVNEFWFWVYCIVMDRLLRRSYRRFYFSWVNWWSESYFTSHHFVLFFPAGLGSGFLFLGLHFWISINCLEEKINELWEKCRRICLVYYYTPGAVSNDDCGNLNFLSGNTNKDVHYNTCHGKLLKFSLSNVNLIKLIFWCTVIFMKMSG